MAQDPGKIYSPKTERVIYHQNCIGLINNNETTRAKANNSNTLVHTLVTELDLKDYVQLHAKIHCQTSHQDNIMHDPLVVVLLTKYHVYKGLNVFGDPGVAEILK